MCEKGLLRTPYNIHLIAVAVISIITLSYILIIIPPLFQIMRDFIFLFNCQGLG